MAATMSHASHASDTSGGGDSTLLPGRTPLSPGGQMRQLYDINSPKVTKPGSRWTEDDNQLPAAEQRAKDGAHGFAADRGVSSALRKRADSSEGSPTARSAAAATGVSTQNLTLHQVSEEHPLGNPVVVGGASGESRASASSRVDHLSSPTSPGKPPVHSGPHAAAPLHKQPSARKVESRGTSKDSLTLTGATSTSASGAVEVETPGPRSFRPAAQAAQQQQAPGTGSKDGSPGGFSPTVRTPSNPPTATPGPGGGDEGVPAGLAALLHQTDRSGKQQKATPTPSTPSAPPPQPQFSSPAVEVVPQYQGPRKVQAPLAPAPSGFFTCCMSSTATQVEHPSPVANPAAVSSGSASQGALDRGRSGSVQQGSGLGAGGSSQGGGGGGSQQARESTASTPRESRASRDGSVEQNGAVGRGSSRKTSLDGPARPKLSMSGSAAEPSAQTPGAKGQRTPKSKTMQPPFTPSAVLSPTSLQVRNSREDVDSYAKQRTPAWGSKHPTVIHAHYETQKLSHHPSMRKTFANARGGVAAMPGARNGGSGSYTGIEDATNFGAGGSFMNMDPVHAMEKEVDALYTPSKSRKVQYGPPPGHDDPPPCQHPVGRINNVRRASSTVGEGPLLGTLMDIDQGKHCLVLDLDETLVHSSFKPVPNADYVLPVEIEGTTHYVYVCKRPGCEEFLTAVGERYEVVLFTASLAKYADPLLDLLDPHNVIRARLFREACVFHEGSYVKDMSLLGRSPASIIIVDNSPASYLFQPENALPCDSFIDEMTDTELYSLADFLIRIAGVADVRQALQQWTSGLWQGGFDLPYVYPDTAHGEGEGESTSKQIVDGNGVPVRDLDTAVVQTPVRKSSHHMQAIPEALGTPSARGSQPGMNRQSSRMKHSDSSSQPGMKRQSSRAR